MCSLLQTLLAFYLGSSLGNNVWEGRSAPEQRPGASRKGWSYLRELISRTRLSQEMFSSLPRCSVPKTSFWKTERKKQTQVSGMLCSKLWL